MSEKHDAMWGADASQYIAQQEAQINRLRGALEELMNTMWDCNHVVLQHQHKIIRKALAKEGK